MTATSPTFDSFAMICSTPLTPSARALVGMSSVVSPANDKVKNPVKPSAEAAVLTRCTSTKPSVALVVIFWISFAFSWLYHSTEYPSTAWPLSLLTALQLTPSEVPLATLAVTRPGGCGCPRALAKATLLVGPKPMALCEATRAKYCFPLVAR